VKIDNSIKPGVSAKVRETHTPASGKSAPTPQTGGGASVQLSGLSVQLQASGDAPVFDAARVSQIKQAIADGKFQINAGAIADRLLSSARELVDAERQS
jgi:negative regulator of flagellin synthesis FlgM